MCTKCFAIMNVIPLYLRRRGDGVIHDKAIYNLDVLKKQSGPLHSFGIGSNLFLNFIYLFINFCFLIVCEYYILYISVSFCLKCGRYGADTDESGRSGHIVGVGRNHSVLVFVPVESTNGVLLQVQVNGEWVAADYQQDRVSSSGDQRHRQTAIKIVRPSIIDLHNIFWLSNN